MSTRVQLAILSQTLNLLPTDSDPATAAAKVQGVKSELDMLQANWKDDVQGNQTEKRTGLQTFLLDYPLPQSDFTAPDASDSTLATQITQAQTHWAQAQKMKPLALPSGLTTTWRLTQQQVTTAIQPAQKQLTNLQVADTQAQKQLTALHSQYTTLSTQVEVLKRTC